MQRTSYSLSERLENAQLRHQRDASSSTSVSSAEETALLSFVPRQRPRRCSSRANASPNGPCNSPLHCRQALPLPPGQPLDRAADPQHHRLVERPPHDLHRQRQMIGTEPTGTLIAGCPVTLNRIVCMGDVEARLSGTASNRGAVVSAQAVSSAS